jgi:hypothetical protein
MAVSLITDGYFDYAARPIASQENPDDMSAPVRSVVLTEKPLVVRE